MIGWLCPTPLSRAFLLAPALVLALAPVARSAETQAGLASYDRYCATCHGADARKLARTTLTLRAGQVITNRRASDLRDLLDHHGRARGLEADQIYALLRSYLTAQPD